MLCPAFPFLTKILKKSSPTTPWSRKCLCKPFHNSWSPFPHQKAEESNLNYLNVLLKLKKKPHGDRKTHRGNAHEHGLGPFLVCGSCSFLSCSDICLLGVLSNCGGITVTKFHTCTHPFSFVQPVPQALLSTFLYVLPIAGPQK